MSNKEFTTPGSFYIPDEINDTNNIFRITYIQLSNPETGHVYILATPSSKQEASQEFTNKMSNSIGEIKILDIVDITNL